MNRTILAGLAACLLTVSAAIAQTTSQPLSPDDAVKLKTWVDKQTLQTVAIPLGFVADHGAVVPDNVMLQEIPDSAGVPAATKYRIAKIGERVVLVDPATRKVLYLIS